MLENSVLHPDPDPSPRLTWSLACVSHIHAPGVTVALWPVAQ